MRVQTPRPSCAPTSQPMRSGSELGRDALPVRCLEISPSLSGGAWSELAIRRTTPALLGLFSVVTLFADRQMREAAGALRRQAAWYRKRHPTFADALAVVRKELWAGATFYGSPAQSDTIKVPRALVERLTDAFLLCVNG